MSFIEFQEALGRIAEEASLPPAPGIFEEDEEWFLEKRRNLPLGYKLEGLILRLLDRCTETLFKMNYPPIQKSIFWVDPDESEFDLVD